MQHNKPAVAHFNMAYLHYKAGKLADAKTHLTDSRQVRATSSQRQCCEQSGQSLQGNVGHHRWHRHQGRQRSSTGDERSKPVCERFPTITQQAQPTGQVVTNSAPNSVPAIQASASAVTPNTGTAAWNPTASLPAAPQAGFLQPTRLSRWHRLRPRLLPSHQRPRATPAPTSPVMPTAVPSQQAPYTLPPGFFNSRQSSKGRLQLRL